MANYDPTRLGKLIVMPQVSAGAGAPAYANPKTTAEITAGVSAGTASVVEAEVFVPNPSRSVFEKESIRGGFYELAPVSGDQHGQEFSIRFPLTGWTATSPATTSPGEHPSSLLMKSILGASVTQGIEAGDVAAGSDADTVNYTAGTFLVGSAVGITDGSTYETSYIKENDTGANGLNLLVAGAVTASTSSTVYGSVTNYVTTDSPLPFSMLWQGYTANSRLLIESAVPTSISVTVSAREPVMAEVTFSTNRVVQSTGGSVLTDFEYTLPTLPVPSGANSARLVFQDSNAGSAFTPLDCEAFTINLTQELVPALAAGATSGVRDMVVIQRTQEIDFSVLIGNKSPFDQTPDGKPFVDISNPSTIGAIQLSVGNTPGNMMAVLIPKPIMMSVPEYADLNGVRASSFKLKPGDFTGDVASSGAATDTNFRISFI